MSQAQKGNGKKNAKASSFSKPPPNKAQQPDGKDSAKGGKKEKKKKKKSFKSNLISIDANLCMQISETMEEFERLTVNSGIKKPVIPCILNSAVNVEATVDTGTTLDLLNETVFERISKESKPAQSVQLMPTRVKVRGAGGKELVVLGKVAIRVDLGKGVIFPAVFLVVRSLGVDMLLGTRTCVRIGMHICFSKPYRIEAPNPAVKGEKVTWPIESETVDIIVNYISAYAKEVTAQVLAAETPMESEIFGSRGEEKGANSHPGTLRPKN